MAQRELTFEEINERIEKADLRPYQAGGAKHISAAAAAKPAELLPNVCGIYKIIEPILRAIASLPLIPKKWKDAIKTFCDLMDQICPSR
jgi:hypothetical protein